MGGVQDLLQLSIRNIAAPQQDILAQSFVKQNRLL